MTTDSKAARVDKIRWLPAGHEWSLYRERCQDGKYWWNWRASADGIPETTSAALFRTEREVKRAVKRWLRAEALRRAVMEFNIDRTRAHLRVCGPNDSSRCFCGEAMPLGLAKPDPPPPLCKRCARIGKAIMDQDKAEFHRQLFTAIGRLKL